MNHSQLCPVVTTVARKGLPARSDGPEGAGIRQGMRRRHEDEMVNPAASARRKSRAIISLTASARRSPASMTASGIGIA